MNFNEYQDEAIKTAQYPDVGDNIIYPAMGLSGEAGECCDKIKKYWRNSGIDYKLLARRLSSIDQDTCTEILKEMGDVLWYLAALARELNVDLDTIAKINIEKLKKRREDCTIKGAGDNR